MLLGRDILVEALISGDIVAFRGDYAISHTELVIGTNSIDVTLGRQFIKVCAAPGHAYIDPWEPASLCQIPLESDTVILHPGETLLGCTQERFEISPGAFTLLGDVGIVDIAPMYEGRSTCGRLFLASHITAGYGDVGFHSAWTLELKNMGEFALMLRAGMRIGQVAFEIVVGGTGCGYRGAYTHQHFGPKAPVLGKERF